MVKCKCEVCGSDCSFDSDFPERCCCFCDKCSKLIEDKKIGFRFVPNTYILNDHPLQRLDGS